MTRFSAPGESDARGELIPSQRSLTSEDDLLIEDRTRLTERLTRLELEHQDLISSVRSFAARYYGELGRRYVERDRLRLRLAERFAAAHPEDAHGASRMEEFRARARATEQELNQARGGPASDDLRRSLRENYLRLAKLVHPDLASSDEERGSRERLMSELNAAYQSGDAQRIDEIARRVSASGDAPGGRRDVRGEIGRLEAAIRLVQQEMDGIRRSDMFILMERAERQARRGRDLVQEIADSLDREIQNLRQALEDGDRNAL